MPSIAGGAATCTVSCCRSDSIQPTDDVCMVFFAWATIGFLGAGFCGQGQGSGWCNNQIGLLLGLPFAQQQYSTPTWVTLCVCSVTGC